MDDTSQPATYGILRSPGEYFLIIVDTALALVGAVALGFAFFSTGVSGPIAVARYFALLVHFFPLLTALRQMGYQRQLAANGEVSTEVMHATNRAILRVLSTSYFALLVVEIWLGLRF